MKKNEQQLVGMLLGKLSVREVREAVVFFIYNAVHVYDCKPFELTACSGSYSRLASDAVKVVCRGAEVHSRSSFYYC